MHQHPSTLLDQALARLERGERLHSILADHPDQADDLASLLAAVRQLDRLKSVPPPPDPEAGLAAFMSQAQAMRSAPPPPPSWRHRLRLRWRAFRHASLYPKLRLALGGLVAVLLLLGLLGGAIALSADSLPGDPLLYPLKLAGEEIRLSLTRTETARAEYQLARAQARVAEMCQLAEKGYPLSQTSLIHLNQALEASLLIAASADPTRADHLLIAIERTTARQLDRLASVKETALSRDTHQRLNQAAHSLRQTLALAQQGQVDWYTFRLNGTLGLFQVGHQASVPDGTTR